MPKKLTAWLFPSAFRPVTTTFFRNPLRASLSPLSEKNTRRFGSGCSPPPLPARACVHYTHTPLFLSEFFFRCGGNFPISYTGPHYFSTDETRTLSSPLLRIPIHILDTEMNSSVLPKAALPARQFSPAQICRRQRFRTCAGRKASAAGFTVVARPRNSRRSTTPTSPTTSPVSKPRVGPRS